MNREACYDRDNDFYMVDMDIDVNNYNQPQAYTNMNNPIVEPMQERVINKTIIHEVPHVCPINTRIVNHHIFRHTYTPQYTCCEENICSNEQCGSCCCNNFR